MNTKFKVSAEMEDYKTGKVLTSRIIADNLTENEAKALLFKPSLLNEGEYFCFHSPFTFEEEEEDMCARDMAELQYDLEHN